MSIKYQEEKAADLIVEIQPLIAAHWDEIALFKESIYLEPDYNKYVELNKLGVLKIYTVRDDDKLVGYFLVTVSPNLHYKSHLFAVNDIIYIDPEYRGRTVAYRLFKYAESELKKLGVSVITINMKVYAKFDRLLTKLGYGKIEEVFGKYIGD